MSSVAVFGCPLGAGNIGGAGGSSLGMGTWGQHGAGSGCLQQQWGGMGRGTGMLLRLGLVLQM